MRGRGSSERVSEKAAQRKRKTLKQISCGTVGGTKTAAITSCLWSVDILWQFANASCIVK